MFLKDPSVDDEDMSYEYITLLRRGSLGRAEQAAQSLPTRGLMCSKWSGFYTGYTGHRHGSFLGLLPHSDHSCHPPNMDTPGTEIVKYDHRARVSNVHSDARLLSWNQPFVKWVLKYWMNQKDECQKGILHCTGAHLRIKLLIKSDDWVWMLGPGRHWVGMTNVGLTSY